LSRFKPALIVSLALALSACALGGYDRPYYGPAASRGDVGYHTTRLDENRYRVEYRTDRSDPGLAQDFAFRRAAEMTLDQRYDWFQVIARNRAVTNELFDRYEPYRYRESSPARVYPDYSDYPDYRGYDQRDAVAVIEIVMGHNPPPRASSVYAARRVLDYARYAYRDRDYRDRDRYRDYDDDYDDYSDRYDRY
jgi:hypothetical protein